MIPDYEVGHAVQGRPHDRAVLGILQRPGTDGKPERGDTKILRGLHQLQISGLPIIEHTSAAKDGPFRLSASASHNDAVSHSIR